MKGIEDGLAGIIEAFSSSEGESTSKSPSSPPDEKRMTE
jgi:hypothetical protein